MKLYDVKYSIIQYDRVFNGEFVVAACSKIRAHVTAIKTLRGVFELSVILDGELKITPRGPIVGIISGAV